MLSKDQATQRIKNTFNHPYNDNNYSIFIKDLLNSIQVEDNFEKQIENDDHIESYKRIGCYEDINGDIIDILSVKVKNGAILERTRTKLRDFTVNHIENSPTDPDGCLVAFHAEEFSDWRFSFVKMDYKVVKDLKTGKFKTDKTISEPKRYSFLIGKDEPSYTAQKQMIPLLQSSNIAFNDIVDAFSTERVTNEFYQAYRALFEDLTLSLVQIKENDPKIKENFEKEFIKEDDFAKKLLGQIVFIYFIQRKGWLGIKKDNNGNFGEWGSGDKKFIRNLFNKKYCQYNNFFNDVLEHLFYNGLGTENSDNYFSLLDCKIPFLNGGIFEPLNNYNWQETDIIIEDKTIEEILDVFDRFNFTVREESELDVDVAVDPEMLGRVFENLLPENMRKGKGAYYTPRAIVNYMCKESIINYLNSETAEYLDLNTIQDLINKNNVEKLSKHNAELLDSLLRDIKICDPAIGSGAFAMGLLNVVVKSRSVLCSLTGEKINKYDLKRYAIINSIFGVDLDPGSVEIAKLRLFLSLIVDEKDFDFIEPLPNLDFQIMQGNSLIEEFYGITLDINKKTVQGEIFEDVNKIDELISNLHQAQTMFSNESNYKRKRELKNKVENCIIDIFKFKYNEKKKYISNIDLKQMDEDIGDIVHGKNPRNFFPWKLYFADIFRSKGGFDIMIANPPYIKEPTERSAFDGLRKSPYYQGKMDLWYIFACLCVDFLKLNGTLTFIATNNWITSFGASKMRNKVVKDTKILKMIDFNNYKIFDSAAIQTMIMMFEKNKKSDDYTFDYRKLNQYAVKFSDVIDILNKKHTGQNEIFSPLVKNDAYLDRPLLFNKPIVEDILTKIENYDNFKLTNNEVANGIHSHHDNVKKKMLNYLDDTFNIGDGIFALSNFELQSLKLTEKEKTLIKPYYLTNEMFKYFGNPNNRNWIIYTSSDYNNPEKMTHYPNIKKHLDRFVKVITSDNKPYGLHRARNEDFFKGEKIISLRKCSNKPSFTYTDFDCYVSAAFYIIKTSKVNHVFLTAFLNSSLCAYWLRYKGKMQGNNYQIDKQPLLNIPIPNISKKAEDKIIDLAHQIINKKKENFQINTTNLEIEIDKLVYKLYSLNEEEIRIIESSIA